MMINDIDEINAFHNGSGCFEINIQTHVKEKDGTIKNATITLSHMYLSMEAMGGIGNQPSIKLIFEGS